MTYPALPQSAGRSSAFIVYCLYLASIPSAGIFAVIGVIWALTARGEAAPLPRQHLDDQVRIWMISFWWHVVLALVCVLGWILTIVLIGFPILAIVACGWFILMVWFTIKSALGLMALLDGRGR